MGDLNSRKGRENGGKCRVERSQIAGAERKRERWEENGVRKRKEKWVILKRGKK